MDDTRLRIAIGLVGLALMGTIGMGAVVGSNSAARDLDRQAAKALVSAGVADVKVDFSGREANLSGGPLSERSKAIEVVESVNGVRRAKFSGQPSAVPAIPAASVLKLSLSDIGATISGVVPNAEVAADLKTAAAEAFGGTASGDFTIDPSVNPADWFDQVPEVFGDLAGVKNLKISIVGDGSIRLSGSIESQVGSDRLEALVASVMPDLTVQGTLTVDPGELVADDAATLNSATLYFARGSSELSEANGATLDRVVEVLTRNPGVTIEAGGHAGPSDTVRGEILSDQRVAAVKAYLVGAGIDPRRVATRSFGSGPSGNDPTAERYRRVDFAVEEN